ncbi:MAG: hypothetical protein HYW07_10385 [Candidatus Latescibacteria bacterium]|nr:hypothetical protein [Candidatus Latescibacterota bacterium]
MRKKIGLAFAVVLTLAALQWAVASVDIQPAATQKVTEEAVEHCPEGKAQCPKSDAASCPKGSEAANCPYSGATKS